MDDATALRGNLITDTSTVLDERQQQVMSTKKWQGRRAGNGKLSCTDFPKSKWHRPKSTAAVMLTDCAEENVDFRRRILIVRETLTSAKAAFTPDPVPHVTAKRRTLRSTRCERTLRQRGNPIGCLHQTNEMDAVSCMLCWITQRYFYALCTNGNRNNYSTEQLWN